MSPVSQAQRLSTTEPSGGDVSSVDQTPSLRSMTGQGIAVHAFGDDQVEVELRTVNHRGIKFSFRTVDCVSPIETRIERHLKSTLRRGSVQVTVRLESDQSRAMSIDQDVLQRYLTQLRSVQSGEPSSTKIDLATLATLPGVMSNQKTLRDPEDVWAIVRPALVAALEDLDRMRLGEGRSMVETLVRECAAIDQRIARVAEIAPRAAAKYAERLDGKIARILSERGIETQPIDLIREVQIYADRCDVSEEITRLGSHSAMFGNVIRCDDEAVGRKLDFIIQEMFRETNTIGSKAADTEISAEVVEIKCALERMRELIQNIE